MRLTKVALDRSRQGADLAPSLPMSALSRLKASPGLLVRALVALGAVAAIAAGLAAFASRRVPLGAAVAEEIAVLVVVGALTRRYGIALPGNGFSSYILGVTAYAILDRGWPFGVVVASLAMIAGDLALRRLPVAAALGNAAHLATGAALAGLAYARLGGATGAQALTASNLVPLVAFLVLLPCLVNGTFYIALALGRTLAWVDAALTARWEAVVYACSVGLALACLALGHASIDMIGFLVIGVVVVSAAVASVSVIRRGVHADELALIQGLSQAIARDISLAKSFPRIQELARRLVPWEHMGFARYDAGTNEMELVADTATGHRGPDKVRFDANAGLSGEAVRRRRRVVADALSPEQVVQPGRETPGSEVLVPLYHAGQLVGLWSVRHSNPGMYHDADGHDRRDPRLKPGSGGIGASRQPGGRPSREPRQRAGPRLGTADPPRCGGGHRGHRDSRLGRADGADHGEGPPRHPDRRPSPDRSGSHHRRERPRGTAAARRGGAGREVLGNHRLHRQPDQPARPQRHDRSGSRRGSRAGLRGGGG